MHRAGTYRVQLSPEFTFDAAVNVVSYLADLGVSHLYASPYLQATAGSCHGYDVVDHGKVNEELGGEPGRKRLRDALTAAGLKQLLDVVPNHMAIRGGHNAWWWDVLENGPSSRYSNYFDVEWQASEFERVLLPILGDQYGVELEAGKITLTRAGGNFLVQYHEHKTPLAPRSLGRLLRIPAREADSTELAFVADTLAELPLPNAPDASSRRRRHRDKEVLHQAVARLCEQPEIARAVDEHLARVSSSPDELHDVLERQIYRLAFWRIGNQELDYRRFFDIDSLVGLRAEDEEVFLATHHLVIDWLNDGSVDGLRVDHVDGLYDPKQYLERVRARAPAAWLLVEKILERNEELPAWPVAGTTGYDFLTLTQQVLIDPTGQAPLSTFYEELAGQETDYGALVRDCKRHVIDVALGSDVQRLVNRLAEICQQHRRYRDYSRAELKQALVEVLVMFPIYRTYASSHGEARDPDRRTIHEACRAARDANPQIDSRLIDFLENLLSLELKGQSELEFVLRFQQLTGPVMAKGVEDTTFYRYGRLVALNEVGGDPSEFSTAAAIFHERMRHRQAHFPEALSSTSTHDTKRSEDVRARLLALSEIGERWQDAVREWRKRLLAYRTDGGTFGHRPAPEPETEYFLLQELVGAWPISEERMQTHMTKAVREAKVSSSWHAPNEAYEEAIRRYLTRLYEDEELCASIARFVDSLELGARANSLNQVMLKLLCPGVPDIYQGTELWEFSLVDPDNRRPVDFALRARLLAELDSVPVDTLWAERENGCVKLWCLRQGLALRGRRPECFGPEGDYTPLSPDGSQADRVLAFRRGKDVIALITRWWLKCGSDFGDTSLKLPEGTWMNPLTGRGQFTGTVQVNDLLQPLPVAVLERQPLSEPQA